MSLILFNNQIHIWQQQHFSCTLGFIVQQSLDNWVGCVYVIIQLWIRFDFRNKKSFGMQKVGAINIVGVEFLVSEDLWLNFLPFSLPYLVTLYKYFISDSIATHLFFLSICVAMPKLNFLDF